MAPLRRARPPHETPLARRQTTLAGGAKRRGGVRERPNRHDWKSCVGQPTVGSNPTLSAAKALVGALPLASGPEVRGDDPLEGGAVSLEGLAPPRPVHDEIGHADLVVATDQV